MRIGVCGLIHPPRATALCHFRPPHYMLYIRSAKAI